MTSSPTEQAIRRRLITAGVLIGIGEAGFFDGIIFHQLLQWHHMFSSIETEATVAGLELNTIGDGLFHVFDWIMISVGIFLLWQLAKQQVQLSTQTFLGAILLGSGGFNVIEGIIDHHLLGIHHVKAGANQLIYDLVFLAVGALIAGIGWLLQQTAAERKAL